MTRKELAKQLRERMVNTEKVTQQQVDCMSDEQMIDAYNTCYCCGEKFLSSIDLEFAITSSNSADEFIKISEQLEYKNKIVTEN